MSFEVRQLLDVRTDALNARVDDLERVCAMLNRQVADLTALWKMIAARPLPRDFGNQKAGGVTVTAVMSRSDAPDAPQFTDPAPDTQELTP